MPLRGQSWWRVDECVRLVDPAVDQSVGDLRVALAYPPFGISFLFTWILGGARIRSSRRSGSGLVGARNRNRATPGGSARRCQQVAIPITLTAFTCSAWIPTMHC